jgi:D-lactate dehydrogenase
MKVAVFSTKSYDQRFLTGAIREKAHELVFFEERLTAKTAGIAAGF